MIFTVLPLFITKFSDGNEIVIASGIVINIVWEIPMFFLAKNIIDRLGYVRCLYVVCLAFVLRYVTSVSVHARCFFFFFFTFHYKPPAERFHLFYLDNTYTVKSAKTRCTIFAVEKNLCSLNGVL